jgi:tight adherence protein C
MLSDIASSLTDPAYLVPILVSVAVFATLFTHAWLRYFERGNELDARMKSAATGAR